MNKFLLLLLCLVVVSCEEVKDVSKPSSTSQPKEVAVLSVPIDHQENSVVDTGTLTKFQPPIGLQDLVDNSDYICRARVTRVMATREQFDPHTNLVMSSVTLEPLENWKGKLPSRVVIRSFGGFLDGLPYFASEFPRFTEGEEVVVLLKQFPQGLFPAGHALGKRTVENSKIKETDESLETFKSQVLESLKK